MLICSNDGFIAFTKRLPNRVGKIADIVPPCQGLIGETGSEGTGVSNPDWAEDGKVRHHRGIVGTEDGLNAAIHNWEGPVGHVIITRID